MKKVLKYTDFILLRLIPMVFLLFVLYSDVRDSIQAFNRIENYSFLLFLESFSLIMCFVFLGLASVLRTFKGAEKFSIASRYGACALALIYIVLYISKEIQTFRTLSSLEYTPSFSNYYSLFTLQKTMYIIALLIVIINCILKDKFFKTKWILTVLCALSIFVALFCNPLYTLINYDDAISFRFLFNSFLFSYCYCAVIITGLSPTKTEEIISKDVVNEEIQNI